jgi:hypothetical protein
MPVGAEPALDSPTYFCNVPTKAQGSCVNDSELPTVNDRILPAVSTSTFQLSGNMLR